MSTDRIHRAISDDGTEIAGRVHGHGPSLVLINSGLSDGDQWQGVAEHLGEHFTCHLMSTRGRGLSSPSPDLTPPRLIEDISAFADSLGEPAGLVGLSTTWLLGAAATCEAVAAVAAYEPAVPEVLSGEDAATIMAMYQRFEAAAAEGRFSDAALELLRAVCNDEEAAGLQPDYLELAGATVPLHLDEIAQGQGDGHPSPTEPGMLARIGVPTLLLYGSRTALADWMIGSVRYLAEHIPGAQVRALDGLGHLGPFAAPRIVAEELIRFFATTGLAPQPAT